MKKVISMTNFIQEKQFNDFVLPFFSKTNPFFNHFKGEDQAVFYIKRHNYLIVFLKFIPANTFTEFPTPTDSINFIKKKPRISHGEWTVECLFDVNEKIGNEIIELFDQNESNKSINHMLKIIKKKNKAT